MVIANAAAENVLGTIGAVCWSVQLFPQVYKSWRRKDVAGLSSWMLAIWFIGGIFLGAYVIVQNINIPLLVQPQCFCALSAVSWAQCLMYGRGWKTRNAVLTALGACILAGGVETALIFGAKAAESNGHSEATTTWGVLSAIFITGGLLPQYYEVYKYKAVIGISLVFLLVDLTGGIFSVLSLVFSTGPFDALASVSYGAVCVLEIGIFLLAAILNPGHRRRVAAQQKLDEEALADDANGTRASSPIPRDHNHDHDDASEVSLGGAKIGEKQGAEKSGSRLERKEEGILGWMDPSVTVEEEGRELERVHSVRHGESNVSGGKQQ